MRARFPVVDVHAHLGRWLTGVWAAPDVGALLATMDAANVETVVNLDGMWGEELRANIARYDEPHPGRFVTFAQWDRSLVGEHEDFPTGGSETGRRSRRSRSSPTPSRRSWLAATT